MPSSRLICVRVTEATKERFRALARREGETESAVLNRLIDAALLEFDETPSRPPPAPARRARLDVRLAPAHRRRLAERAAARGMPSATYVSLLIRTHLDEEAPLPKAELAALLNANAELAAIGRNLNQLVRAVNAGREASGFTVENGKVVLRAVTGIRDRVKALVTANTASWRDGQGRG